MFFLNASMAGIIFYGSVLYEEGEITVGAISAFLLYMIQLLMGFMVFSFVFTNVVKVEGASKTIIDMMRWVPFVNSKGGDKINEEDLSGEIELQDVCFTYPSKKEISILSNVNIKVEKNKVIALVGQSGCGKSTIISLIERFYDPISGKILFNGKDIKDLDP
jgi:ATP-binding cassette subfamily B multidrug efflux pump